MKSLASLGEFFVVFIAPLSRRGLFATETFEIRCKLLPMFRETDYITKYHRKRKIQTFCVDSLKLEFFCFITLDAKEKSHFSERATSYT